MQRIRAIYVPELILWLHNILLETRQFLPENLERCLDLANLVAGVDGSQLYEEFIRSNKLEKFLREIRKSSTLALAAGNAPWTNK